METPVLNAALDVVSGGWVGGGSAGDGWRTDRQRRWGGGCISGLECCAAQSHKSEILCRSDGS